MVIFSQRLGIKEPKQIIQKESMDDDLKVGLWNVLSLYIWEELRKEEWLSYDERMHSYFKALWIGFFKRPLDTLELYTKNTYSGIRADYFSFEWYEAYDFIEFTIKRYPGYNVNTFINDCNNVLERELSAYRIVDESIVEITSKEEIEEIESAIDSSPNYVSSHLRNALDKISDKNVPDYRNSIKESISAVEAICKKISNNVKATLGDALNIIEKSGKVEIHPALKESFKKLYGYTNEEGGIRHSLLDKDKLEFEDARFFLVSSSSFINYLIIKSDKAGIKL